MRYLNTDDDKSAIIEVKSLTSANGTNSVSSWARGSSTAPLKRKQKKRTMRHYDDLEIGIG